MKKIILGILGLWIVTVVGAQLVPRATYFLPVSRSQVILNPKGDYITYFGQTNSVPGIFMAPVNALEQAQRLPVEGQIVMMRWITDSQLFLWKANQTITLFERHSNKETQLNGDHPVLKVVALGRKNPDQICAVLQTESGPALFRLERDKAPQKIMDMDQWQEIYVDDDFIPRAGKKLNQEYGFTLYYRDANNQWQYLLNYPWDISRSSQPINEVLTVSADGSTLYLVDNLQDDKASLKSVDLTTNQTQVLAKSSHADIHWQHALIHPIKKIPQAVNTFFLKQEWSVLDSQIASDIQNLSSRYQVFYVVSRSKDDINWMIRHSNGGAFQYSLYNRKTGACKVLFGEIPEFDTIPEASRYGLPVSTRDGLELPCQLYLPAGTKTDDNGIPLKPLPTILYVHGGPWIGNTKNQWLINRHLQLLANRGYAVVNTEFRGALGFGKSFFEKSLFEWGGKMHQDLLDIKEQLVNTGIADESRCAIWGWSYGGYAVSFALANAPDAFKCGITMYGVHDLETFVRTPFWRAVVGNPETEEGRKILRQHNPIMNAKKIMAPLLITHGEQDKIVPIDQSTVLANAIPEGISPMIYTTYPNEGHDYQHPQTWCSFWAIAEQFLAQVLGGDFQPKQQDIDLSKVNVEKGSEWIHKLK